MQWICSQKMCNKIKKNRKKEINLSSLEWSRCPAKLTRFLHFFRRKVILLDFSLTVKAATLIFISGRGSAI